LIFFIKVFLNKYYPVNDLSKCMPLDCGATNISGFVFVCCSLNENV